MEEVIGPSLRRVWMDEIKFGSDQSLKPKSYTLVLAQLKNFALSPSWT